MENTVEKRLKKLGVTLPEPPKSVAKYLSWQFYQSLIFVSGQAPFLDGAYRVVGKVGGDKTLEEGQYAARICALNILAVVKQACEGDLERVEKVVSVRGFVNAVPEFKEVPQVINGASELIIDVFGPEIGRHARTSIGCVTLPSNVTVEVDAIFAIKLQ